MEKKSDAARQRQNTDSALPANLPPGVLWWPSGKAILAPNHISFFDGPAIARRYARSRGRHHPCRILFGIDADYAKHPLWSAALDLACKVWRADYVAMSPASPFGLRRMLLWLDAGGMVCVFPSGAIGSTLTHPGIDFLSRRSGAPIYTMTMTAGPGAGRYAWTSIAAPGCLPAGA